MNALVCTVPRHKWLAISLLAAAVGSLYASTLSPGAYWLDSSEFIAGAHTLGVVHPPGHPLYVLLAKAFSLLIPIGTIGFRIALFSALLGIGCALMVATIVADITRQRGEQSAWGVWCGAATGWLFAMTQACWMQSIRAEVYTLNALLVLVGIWLALRWWRDGGHHTLYFFALLTGLGLANHHYLFFFFLPAPIVLLLMRPDGRTVLLSQRLAWIAMLAFLSLTCYAYLPLRALTDPVINWGDPTTWNRFFDVLSAKTFQGGVTEMDTGPLHENLAIALGMFANQVSVPGLIVGLGGLLWLVWRNRSVGLFLLITFLLNLLTKSIQIIDPENPDDYGYFLVGIAILTIAIGAVGVHAVHAIKHARTRLGTAVVWGLLLCVGGTSLAADNWSAVDLSEERSAEVLVDASLNALEPDAIVLVHYYSYFFNHWLAQLVDGRRPDVAMVQATFDSKRYDGAPYIAGIRRRWPVLKPVLDDFERNHFFPEKALLALTHQRPVYMEPMIERVMDPHKLDSVGMVRRLGMPPTTDEQSTDYDALYWAPIETQLQSPEALGKDGQKLLAWFHFSHAALALRQSKPGLALQVIERAKRFRAQSRVFTRLETLALELQELIEASKNESLRSISAQSDLARRQAYLSEMNYVDLLYQ